jgi:phosphotransferase system HPr-like phosphotransfer protein
MMATKKQLDVPKEDKINPNHYGANGKRIQAIDIIELFDLNFSKGNVIKYTLRSGRKAEQGYDALTKEIEDLEKAKWYLEREIERLKKEQTSEVE